MAATEGSLRTTPRLSRRPAYWRSPGPPQARLAGRQVFRLTSCPFRALASVRYALAEATAGLISIATPTWRVPLGRCLAAKAPAYVRDGCVSPQGFDEGRPVPSPPDYRFCQRETARPASAAAFAQALEACRYDPQSGHHRQAAEDRAAEAGSPSRWTRRPASSREPLRRASRRSPDPDSLGRPAFSVPAKRAQTAPSGPESRFRRPGRGSRLRRWSRWERRLPCS